MIAKPIEILNFSFSFIKNKTELKVLNNISLEIKNSEFVVLIGPSGSGKTTLLKLIGGLITSEKNNIRMSGKLTVDGFSPAVAKEKKYFGFAFQNPVLLPWRNVRQNISLPLELLVGNKNIDESISDGILKLLDISDFNESFPRQLSGGMQQRVNIGRALIHNPKVLLLDEPFGSLDEITREKLNIFLHKIHKVNRQTIVFITHNISEAVFLADKIVILSHRPAKIFEIVQSNLPTHRDEETLKSPEYLELLNSTREKFFTLNAK